MDPLKDQRELEALLAYSREYNIKKRKSGLESQLVDIPQRYVIYARKSTEDDKRQVQSIEDQIDHCKKYASENKLSVVDIRREEKSAKIAGKRKVFNDILETIREGNSYNSILSWHPDRLARNMKESGEILDLLDNGKLVDLKFVSHSFTNDAAGKMTLSILFAMAKEFSDKLSTDTKRGIEKKVLQGLYCGTYKRGYIFTKNGHFRPDQDTFEIYKDVWRRALKGEPHAIIKQAHPEEHIPVSNYLKDPFPTGIYCYGNKVVNILEVDPAFTPLVTPEEFITIQRKSKQNVGWHTTSDFLPFRDLVKCNECGSYMIPGRSANRYKVKYLYITCGNKICRARRKELHKPANSIRAGILVNTVVEYLNNNLAMNKELYDKVILDLRDKESLVLNELKTGLKSMKSKRTALFNQERAIEEQNLNDNSKRVMDKRISEMLIELDERDTSIMESEKRIAELESKIAIELPDYEIFLNFFKNIVSTLETTQDPHLMDKLIKFVFLNFSIGEKNVLSYELNEPFNSYRRLKNHSGVEDGT